MYVCWCVRIFSVFPRMCDCVARLSDALTPLRCLRFVKLPGFYSPLHLIVAPQAAALRFTGWPVDLMPRKFNKMVVDVFIMLLGIAERR